MSSTILPPQTSDRMPPSASRLSVAEYHGLIAEGVLGENDRVELLEGCIVSKMTHNPLHDGIIQIVSKRISRCLPAQWDLRIQSAVTTSDSEPEPDIVVVRGDERAYLSRHPSPADIALLIEVAESSLNLDRIEKARLYARAKIAVYWIINLIDAQIEVFSDPTGVIAQPEYRQREIFRADALVPVVIDAVEVTKIPAKDLLP